MYLVLYHLPMSSSIVSLSFSAVSLLFAVKRDSPQKSFRVMVTGVRLIKSYCIVLLFSLVALDLGGTCFLCSWDAFFF